MSAARIVAVTEIEGCDVHPLVFDRIKGVALFHSALAVPSADDVDFAAHVTDTCTSPRRMVNKEKLLDPHDGVPERTDIGASQFERREGHPLAVVAAVDLGRC